ncbi:MAG: nucleotidyl transferase AbiEii/AbiGii toxin family protein [Gammaproteobacteria bacterium]|nr:nucleotidyl transferase AbiEii/AbiGii toxin family protein [Gammaproteobacteria bacterium]
MLNKFHNKKTANDIEDLAELLELSEYVIEKDLYLTEAIALVSQIANEFYELVFQGGTSLSKAHRIIERMSEDCDFRIVLKNSEHSLSKEKRRKTLRDFRHHLIATLQKHGFSIDENAVMTRNEGQFMEIRASYPSLFEHAAPLKPYIALEFFLADVKITPEKKRVTTLVRQIFGDDIAHSEFLINSMAIVETAAEKWVGLTRRIATSKHREYYHNPHLVRHLYDLYQIHSLYPLSEAFDSLAVRIALDDRTHYKTHNSDYYKNPANEIRRAMDELSYSKDWYANWNKFIDAMVFSKEKPTYTQVIKNFQKKTHDVLNQLEQIDFSDRDKI